MRSDLTFGDETSTGVKPDRRRLVKATIAAQIMNHDLGWWFDFKKEAIPGYPIKSETILRIVEEDARARGRLLNGLCDKAMTSIVIVDPCDQTDDLLRSLYKKLGLQLPSSLEAIPIPKAAFWAIKDYVSELMITNSPLPRIEHMVNEALRSGPVYSGKIMGIGELVPRDVLRKLTHQNLRQLTARFAMAYAEALHPDSRAEAVREAMETSRYLQAGDISYLTLERSVEPSRIFDQGSMTAFQLLEQTHARMVEALEMAAMGRSSGLIVVGSISQEDSEKTPGLEVADIAAAFARDVYESASGSSLERATEVRKYFHQVLLNDRWI